MGHRLVASIICFPGIPAITNIIASCCCCCCYWPGGEEGQVAQLYLINFLNDLVKIFLFSLGLGSQYQAGSHHKHLLSRSLPCCPCQSGSDDCNQAEAIIRNAVARGAASLQEVETVSRFLLAISCHHFYIYTFVTLLLRCGNLEHCTGNKI